MKKIYKYLFSIYILAIGLIILAMIWGKIDHIIGNKILISLFVFSFITWGIINIKEYSPKEKDKY